MTGNETPPRSDHKLSSADALVERVGAQLLDAGTSSDLAAGLIASSAFGLYLLDPHLEIQFVNQRLCELLGYQRDEMLHRHLSDFLHPDDNAVTHALAGTLRDPDVPGYAVVRRFRHRDGQTVWARLTASCIRDPATAKPRYGFGVLQDITAFVDTENERDRLRRAVRRQETSQALGTVTAKITHDFNNLLGAILGFSELAQSHARDGEQLGRYLEQIRSAANRANTLVEQLISFSRGDEGHLGTVSVCAIAQETLDLLYVLLPDGIRIEHNLPDAPCYVHANEGQIHQLVMNLCTNAGRAMPNGGTLTVQVETNFSDQVRQLSAGPLPAGRHIRITVRDEGVGLAAEKLRNLFDDFYAGESAATEGSGLGLAIVNTVTRSLNGQIDVRSTLGKGTAFDVYLPAAEAPQDGIVSGTSPGTARGNGERLLLVDDEASIVSFGEQALTETGYHVTGLTDSVAALHQIQAAPDRFDLLITDLAMPRMSGVELAQAATALRPDLPVILITALASRTDCSAAQRAGVREIITKPFSICTLTDGVSRQLQPA